MLTLRVSPHLGKTTASVLNTRYVVEFILLDIQRPATTSSTITPTTIRFSVPPILRLGLVRPSTIDPPPLSAGIVRRHIWLKHLATFRAEIQTVILGHMTIRTSFHIVVVCLSRDTCSSPILMRMRTTIHTITISATSFRYPWNIGASHNP